MDDIFCKSQTKEKRKNQLKIFRTIAILFLWYFFLVSCAADPEPSSWWIKSLETLPRVEGFSRAGVFTINKKVYVQFCDPEGNQIWMRYNEKTLTWRQSRYNSLGCVRGENSTGPDAE